MESESRQAPEITPSSSTADRPKAPDVVALVTAAGSGTRLGANMPKALVELAGEPLIVHALRGVADAGITKVVITVPDSARDELSEVALRTGADLGLVIAIAGGGATRQESVAHGLALVDEQFVLIHDAARCLTPASVIVRVVDALREGYRAVVPVQAVTDTVKEVAGDWAPGHGPEKVIVTLRRSRLRAVQTPQGFETDLVKLAHERGASKGTSGEGAPDDATLVEAMGESVWLVEGSPESLKITTPQDLRIAEMLLDGRDRSMPFDRVRPKYLR